MQEQEENENELCIREDKDEKHAGYNNVFCYAALADKQTETIYTDATGWRATNIILWHTITTRMPSLPFL